MKPEDFQAAVEKVNAGAPLETTDASLVENFWTAMSQIPKPQRNNVAIGMQAIGFDEGAMPPSGSQQVAVLMRVAVVEALYERGLLEEYMKDAASRKKFFEAAASFPCDINDLSEALADRSVRTASPELQESMMAELKKAGFDPNHLQVADKLLSWMRKGS